MQNEENPRLTPLSPAEWDDEILDALGAFPGSLNFVLKQWNEDSGDLRGMHTLGLFAHYPELAKAFMTLNKHVATESTLSARERELLILRISWLKKSEYEFVQHIILGRRAGLTDEEIERLQQGPSTPGWSEEDADLIRVADELHTEAGISSDTWERLSHRYNHRQVLDMIFLVGCYAILGTAIKSFNIPLEPGVAPLSPEIKARMFGSSNADTSEDFR